MPHDVEDRSADAFARPLSTRRSEAFAPRLAERFARLLEYPSSAPDELCAALVSDCTAVDPHAAVQLAAFAAAAAQMELSELQELYTKTFDFEADTALYVGHQLFGEEGRRGLLMAGLVERYRVLGVDPGIELADHFAPVTRSLAADAASDEARELVRCALLPAIAKVIPAVERRAPAYAALLTALASVLDAQAGAEFGTDAWTSSCSPFFPTLR